MSALRRGDDRLIQTPQRVDALLKIKGMLVNPGVVMQAV